MSSRGALIVMVCAVLVAPLDASGMECSSACRGCCPRGADGEWLKLAKGGNCADAGDKLMCRLGGGRCPRSADKEHIPMCDEIPLSKIWMDEVMPGEVVENTFLADGMRAWNSEHPEGHSALHNIPAYYHGFAALIPHQRLLGAETEVRFMCPAGASGDCDAVVFLYECFPCASEKGGIPSQLAVEGFERSNCGPTFTTGKKDGRNHPMTSYRKTLKPGQVYSVTTAGSAEWIAFAMGHGGNTLTCGGASKEDCEDKTQTCVWSMEEEKCRPTSCKEPTKCTPDACVSKDYDGFEAQWLKMQ